MKENLTQYEHILQILEEKGFFKFTVKTVNKYNHIYSFRTFKWHDMIQVNVNTIKYQNMKVINNIYIGKQQINSYEKFMQIMNNLYKIHTILKNKQKRNKKETK